MPVAIDLKKGGLIQIDGDPYQIVEKSVQTPTARGGATYVKVKVKNLRTKLVRLESFKAPDRVEEPNFEVKPCQYLYNENGENYYFMLNDGSYEQFMLMRDSIEYELQFIRENEDCRVMMMDGEAIGIQVPDTVILQVVECEPAIKGDTVTAATKKAKLETGLEVQVPLFLEQDTMVVIDTKECRYLKRA